MQQIADSQIGLLRQIAARLMNGEVECIEPIGGGGNSQVYLVKNPQSQKYVLKVYFRHRGDDRDRLRTEYEGLCFLWKNGIREIPRPIGVDWVRGCALYDYVDGGRIASSEVTFEDMEAAIRFLGKLRDLSGQSESRSLAPASEACFSVQAIVENIRGRFDRLSMQMCENPAAPALSAFLADEFVPAFETLTRWSRSCLRRAGIAFEEEVDISQRTLSPSDFGFHNAVRGGDGRIVFLDFEYFGWDDPAKMIADFLLHPATQLSESHKRRFATRILGLFENDRNLGERIKVVYPLFALKWCMIMLNEFVPEYLLRRGFARKSNLDKDDVQKGQLLKARQMLHRIRNEYAHFPYFC